MANFPIFKDGLPFFSRDTGHPVLCAVDVCNLCGDDPCSCFDRNGLTYGDRGYGCDLPWVTINVTKTSVSFPVEMPPEVAHACHYHCEITFAPPAGVTVVGMTVVLGPGTQDDPFLDLSNLAENTSFDFSVRAPWTYPHGCGEVIAQVWYSTDEGCEGGSQTCFGQARKCFQCCECGECSKIESWSVPVPCSTCWWFADSMPEQVYLTISSSGCDPACAGNFILPWDTLYGDWSEGKTYGYYKYESTSDTHTVFVVAYVAPCSIHVSYGENWYVEDGLNPGQFLPAGETFAQYWWTGVNDCCEAGLESTPGVYGGYCFVSGDYIRRETQACGTATLNFSCSPLPPPDPPTYPQMSCSDFITCGDELPAQPGLFLSVSGLTNDACTTGADPTDWIITFYWRNLNRGYTLERNTVGNTSPFCAGTGASYWQQFGEAENHDDPGLLVRVDEHPEGGSGEKYELYAYGIHADLECDDTDSPCLQFAHLYFAFQQFYFDGSDWSYVTAYSCSVCFLIDVASCAQVWTCVGTCLHATGHIDYSCDALTSSCAGSPRDQFFVVNACIGSTGGGASPITHTYTPGTYTLDLAGVSNLHITIRSADENGPNGGEGCVMEGFVADLSAILAGGDTALNISVSAAGSAGWTGLSSDFNMFLFRACDGGFDGPGIGGHMDLDDFGWLTTTTPGADNAVSGAGADGYITLTYDLTP